MKHMKRKEIEMMDKFLKQQGFRLLRFTPDFLLSDEVQKEVCGMEDSALKEFLQNPQKPICIIPDDKVIFVDARLSKRKKIHFLFRAMQKLELKTI